MKSLSTTRSNQMLALLAVAQLMGVLDFSIVNIALAVGGNPSGEIDIYPTVVHWQSRQP
jgi:hypothetical protein